MSWLDEMEAADSAYPGDVSYPAARTRAGRGLYQLHAGLDDGHLNAARDLIADWYARQANHTNEARPGGSGRVFGGTLACAGEVAAAFGERPRDSGVPDALGPASSPAHLRAWNGGRA